MTKEQQIIDKLAIEMGCCTKCECSLMIRPVYKMHVEEFLMKSVIVDPRGNIYKKLRYLWAKCGITKSLQQIVEESGYEAVGHETMDEETGEYYIKKRLKSPQARELFEFLDPIIQ